MEALGKTVFVFYHTVAYVYPQWQIQHDYSFSFNRIVYMKHFRSRVSNYSIYKNKLDSEYVAKNIYIQTANQLKKTNQELYDEIKNLKDNPVVVTKVVT